MATGEGKDGNKYEWQSWPPDSLEGMPPKRRRLVGWTVVFWFILLGGLLGPAAEAAGIAQPWRSLLVAAVLAAVFVPLIRGAVLETRQLRAEGIELPGYPATRKTVITNALLAGVLWTLFAVTAAIDMPVFPLLPIAATIWLVYLIRRWKAGSHGTPAR
ncbi:hypothetical protein [Arthrobacter sp. ISL-28]|uniref:hypothetical protein n=1 Tax=Arthrobacter sp. ISL-28 TaxID=2819108 RepID=UPI001BE4EE13|nr:hypothetical protein [Arthrobacter sp. ISL-28]MBT2521857.1 hypothetical protein [Arthrobacter sp. ISL-28]